MTISYRYINSTKRHDRECCTCDKAIFTGDPCIRLFGSCEDSRHEKKTELFKHVNCATGYQVYLAKVGNERHRAARRKRYAKKMLKKFGEFPPSDERKQTGIDFDEFVPF